MNKSLNRFAVLYSSDPEYTTFRSLVIPIFLCCNLFYKMQCKNQDNKQKFIVSKKMMKEEEKKDRNREKTQERRENFISVWQRII